MFLSHRTVLNVRTRNKSSRPKIFSVGESDKDINDPFPEDFASLNVRWRDVPVNDYPAVLILLGFPPPGILCERKDGDGIHFNALIGQIIRPGKQGEKNLVTSPLIPEAFMRMLAKIAHGIAVAELGQNAFVPLLPDYIIGDRVNFNFVIGSSTSRSLKREDLVWCSLHLEQGFIIASIQLFAIYAIFQPYKVVVGRATQKSYSSSTLKFLGL